MCHGEKKKKGNPKTQVVFFGITYKAARERKFTEQTERSVFVDVRVLECVRARACVESPGGGKRERGCAPAKPAKIVAALQGPTG